MSEFDKPTAKVTEFPTGQLDVVLTIPGSLGPVTLSMGVYRDEETRDWCVMLPLWPMPEYFRDRDNPVICPGFEKAFDDDPDDPEDRGQYWDVSEGGTACLIEPEVP